MGEPPTDGGRVELTPAQVEQMLACAETWVEFYEQNTTPTPHQARPVVGPDGTLVEVTPELSDAELYRELGYSPDYAEEISSQ